MLNVSSAAAGHLAQVLEQAPGDAVVRLEPQGNALAMTLGEPRPEDTTFQHDEKTVLAISPPVAQALSERTLDLQETPQGPQLSIS
ncbi:MAG: hypothetical protein KY476_24005 [Planctomycetes bacterium]|nr:hypothetical protein [Planctomycetota bacterium]